MKTTILIVEDDRTTREVLNVYLKKYDYSTIQSSNFKDAIEGANKHKPDLILMDIHLNDAQGDGIDAAEQIYKDTQIPIIYVTADTEDRTMNRALLTKPFGYLVKPITEDMIKHQIPLAFSIKEQLDEQQFYLNSQFNNIIASTQLDNYGIGIITMRNNLEILNINKNGLTMLGTNKNVNIINNKLVLLEDKNAEHLRQSLDNNLDTYITIHSENNMKLDLLFSEVIDSQYVIFMFNNSSTNENIIETLKSLYGFTQKEAEVAHHVSCGDTAKEVAEKLNISYDGARHHINSLLRKTNTNRKDNFVHLMRTGPAKLLFS